MDVAGPFNFFYYTWRTQRSDIMDVPVYSSFSPEVCWLLRPGLDRTNLLENLAACKLKPQDDSNISRVSIQEVRAKLEALAGKNHGTT
jgi:hypothetical protein